MRARLVAAVVAGLVSFLAFGGVGGAQEAPTAPTLPPPPEETTTTTTEPEPTTTTTEPAPTTTTTQAPRRPDPTPSTTAYTLPPPSEESGTAEPVYEGGPPPKSSSSSSGGGTSSGGGSGSPPPGGGAAAESSFGGFDPFAFGSTEGFTLDAPPPMTTDYVPVGGARSTLPVLSELKKLGTTPTATLAASILVPFPAIGPADYAEPPSPRKGAHVYAASGTPVVAAGSGKVDAIGSAAPGVPGKSVRLTTDDGTSFVYGHLDRLAQFLYEGTLVAKGEVLGYIGAVPDPAEARPFLYFDVVDGAALSVLDWWIVGALQRARELTGSPLDEQRSKVQELVQDYEATVGEAADARSAADRLRRVVDVTGTPADPAVGIEPFVIGVVVVPVAWLMARRGRKRRLELVADGLVDASSDGDGEGVGGWRARLVAVRDTAVRLSSSPRRWRKAARRT